MPYSFNPLSGLGLDQSIPLDGAGKIPSDYLPSYVDDVVEYANLAGFPATGETGKIYVAIDTGFTYRWSGSVYIQINSLTGTFAANAGTAAAPSISIGTTDNGLYAPAEDQVAISTNGTGALFIDANQQVYIKQSSQLSSHSSPSLELTGDVVINSSAFGTGNKSSLFFYHRRVNDTATRPGSSINSETEDIYASGSAGTFDSALLFNTVLNNVSGERLRITSDGKLGLGTSSPVALLHLSRSGTGDYTAVRLSNTGASGRTYEIGLGGNTAAAGFANNLYFYDSTAGATRMVVDSSGRVGIGDNVPGSTLTVKGATGVTPLQISGPSSEFMRCDSSGRVLVGTSSRSDTPKLVVQGNVGGGGSDGGILALSSIYGASIGGAGAYVGQIKFTDSQGGVFGNISCQADDVNATNDYPGRLVFSVTADGSASPTEALRISNNRAITVSDGGNVVLGTTTGTKIGTATTQKLGFYNATPVVQPAAVADATDAATVITQLNDLLAKLRTLGLIAT